ncbi:hypothetical protein B0H15DRAFT_569432 [Mycena belliarum]|uniref:Uncharacterized protein n=1 Tax=Mycena belliarum TaxID=1033014 RepID=A0AAD6TSZ3_9AGAR|nr:hypothetical protein B0H15DRAFT_569432 [Mycena belliae]
MTTTTHCRIHAACERRCVVLVCAGRLLVYSSLSVSVLCHSFPTFSRPSSSPFAYICPVLPFLSIYLRHLLA